MTNIASALEQLATNQNAPSSPKKIKLTSNVARDALKRASDFKSIPDCIFESIANGVESYNVGEVPKIWVTIEGRGRDTTISIRDNGIGMSYPDGLEAFLSLHRKTERRENGLNMRGYNGTGKIAAFKFADRLEVETVKDGLRTIIVMTGDILRKAAATGAEPEGDVLVENRPTTDQNGTVIRISKIKKEFQINAEVIRDLKNKISYEKMMWMHGSEIYVNGEEVAAQVVDGEKGDTIVSECGNFELNIYFRGTKDVYAHELPAVYMTAGRVFLARELFGMEGRAFAKHVHVDARASEEWAHTHFYDNREKFVSERRDLKLNLVGNPEAKRFADFVTIEVSKFMDKLDAEREEQRRSAQRAKLNELERSLVKHFSGMLSVLGGKKRVEITTGDNQDNDNVVSIRKKVSGSSGDANKPNGTVGIEIEELNEDVAYIVDYDSKRLRINQNFGPMKAMTGKADTYAYQIAVTEVVIDAFTDLMTRMEADNEFGDRDVSRFEVMEHSNKIASMVRLKARGYLVDCYRKFAEAEERYLATTAAV